MWLLLSQLNSDLSNIRKHVVQCTYTSIMYISNDILICLSSQQSQQYAQHLPLKYAKKVIETELATILIPIPFPIMPLQHVCWA